MVRSVFLCDQPSMVERVYEPKVRARIRQRFELGDWVAASGALEERAQWLSSVECAFSTWGMPALSGAEIARWLPNLKAVFYAAGSVQHFARPFLERGVRVFSAWGANALPVVDFTVAQVVLANKGFFQCALRYRTRGRAAARAFSEGQTGNYRAEVGVLGAGMIGREVIRRLTAIGLEVLVYDPYVADGVLEHLGGRRSTLEEIFQRCPVVSNHIANRPETVGMLDYRLFSTMGERATFINTGRGQQVVEADLIRALEECPDRTAVLDVTWPEPPAPGSPLERLENVILTPHIAGSMGRELWRMAEYMAEESARWLEGATARYEVSLAMLDTMA